jgi:phosphocarrier protein FPr
MVGLVLVSHSRDLATALAEFARRAVAEPIPVACAAGVESVELGTDAQAIAEAIRSVHGPDGVLVLMDLGSAVLAAETALELLSEEERTGVRLCPAPLVEAAAAVKIAGRTRCSAAEAAQALAQGRARRPTEAPRPGAPPPGLPGSHGHAANAHGLHLRPAARLVRAAAGFRAEVLVGRPASGRPPVPAVSLNAVATLGLGQGEQVLFRARGSEARQALDALCRLAAERFGEGSTAEAPERPLLPPLLWHCLLQGIPVSEDSPPDSCSSSNIRCCSIGKAASGAGAGMGRAAGRAGRRRVPVEREPVRGPRARKAELLEAFRLILRTGPAGSGPGGAVERGRTPSRPWTRASAMAGRFRGLADAYARERASDILDLGQRVLRRLRRAQPGVDPVEPLPLPASGPVLLAAEELFATDAAGLEPQAVLGVLTVRGGGTSHASVLVRSLGIPCITGLPESLLRLPSGTPAAMDGGRGRLWIGPDAPTLALVESGRAGWLRRREAEAAAARQPAVSRDGRRFLVEANIAGNADARQAVAQGGEGVGCCAPSSCTCAGPSLRRRRSRRRPCGRSPRRCRGGP